MSYSLLVYLSFEDQIVTLDYGTLKRINLKFYPLKVRINDLFLR